MERLDARTTAYFALLPLAGCLAGHEPAEPSTSFRTTLAADAPLANLRPDELDALCHDQASFLSQPTFREDSCRISAILQAALGVFSDSPTDTELRVACASAYERCLSREPEPECGVSPAPLGCTATVGDVAGCLEDGAAQLHALALAAPDCDSLSANDMPGAASELPAAATQESESCTRLKTTCPDISAPARAYADEYCALAAPCCSQAGLGSECTVHVYRDAEEGSYDAALGRACLDALRARSSSAGFCESFERGWSTRGVIPECSIVFGGRPEELISSHPLATTAGAACIGTRVATFNPSPAYIEAFGPSMVLQTEGAVCDHDANLRCDALNSTCVGAKGEGAQCNGFEECDQSTYCDQTSPHGSESWTCKRRVRAGGACDGSPTVCAAPGHCDSGTGSCTLAAEVGAECSTTAEPGAPHCASGLCVEGRCEHPLAPLCGS